MAVILDKAMGPIVVLVALPTRPAVVWASEVDAGPVFGAWA
ncbi:hypothetical protein [Streptomyces griseicoloratus]|nr:hypothetical protein [Streptomyces griseicoloratus]